jgi:hypothetical protein
MAVLFGTHLEDANLKQADLDGSHLRSAFFNVATYFSATHVSSAEYGGCRGSKARDTTSAEHADPRYLPLPRYWVPHAEVERALVGWPARGCSPLEIWPAALMNAHSLRLLSRESAWATALP